MPLSTFILQIKLSHALDKSFSGSVSSVGLDIISKQFNHLSKYKQPWLQKSCNVVFLILMNICRYMERLLK